jgi:hypothetical protein
MSFLYPQFLFGLLAVAIPIIIHLFNFQKPKKVLFTNVRFLKHVKETTSSRLKLKHLLILISRICFIIFLVLMFAQPFLESRNSQHLKGSQFVSIYLDNSFSMENEVEKEKALDIAIKSMGRLTEIYPSNTLYYLLTNDFEGKDQFIRNKEKLNERITEIKFSNIFRDGKTIYKRQLQGKEKTSSDNHHVFWFTDFQKSTIGDMDKVPFDSMDKVYLVPIQNESRANVFIDSVWLSSPLIKANENNQIEVRVRNEGDKPVKDIILKLFINEVQVSTNSIDIPPASSYMARFAFNIQGQGEQKCRISFEDFPVAFDNEYFFILNVAPKIKILHLYEKSAKSIPSVYSNESIFEIHSSPSGSFDFSLIAISDLIILEGLKEIPAGLEGPLFDFIKKGGSLILFPSDNFNPDNYNKILSRLSVPRVNRLKADSSIQKVNVTLQAPDVQNPFFKGMFERLDINTSMTYSYPVMEWSSRGDLLLKYRNGNSFLSSFPAEKGRVYLCAGGLDPRLSNLTQHSLFVLIMYKIAFNSMTEGERLAWSFQEPVITMNVESANTNEIFSISNEGLKLIPGQRLTGRSLTLEIPKDQMRPGFYELKKGESVEKYLAFNYGKEESSMDFLSPENLRKAFSGQKNIQVYDVNSHEDFIEKFKNENIGVSLWKYCLILSLVFLAIEILLIRFL